MRTRDKLFVSMAAAVSLGASSLPASAAAPLGATLYGDLAGSFVYTGKGSATGHSSYGLYDNVSLLGVKGNAAITGATKFIYDFNAQLDMMHYTNVSPPLKPFSTHLAYVGVEGPYGTVTVGRDNGLYSEMVDGGIYLTNWYIPSGISALQVSQAIKYVSPAFGGFKIGVQGFDIGQDSTSGKSTNDYTVAGQYAVGSFTVGAGYTSYSKYADGSGGAHSDSTDLNQFFAPTNTFAGQVLASMAGGSVGYSADKFGVVGVLDVRKPANNGTQNIKDIDTVLVTGTYAMTNTVSLVGNVSSTSQASDGAKAKVQGTIVTLMVSYAPADNVFYSIEVQSADKKANESSLDGTLSAGGDKANTGFAVSATYSF